ncbi:hypothetical protein evm_001248 [Chilo suppressalis]|nr:hypothetical protein evm_001248 [Chilo suppressalis]
MLTLIDHTRTHCTPIRPCPLRSEYISYAPLSYIYYSAGRRARAPESLRASICSCALATAHAHIVAPLLCTFAASSAADAGMHGTLVKGALLSCAGGPCAWLSLCACRDAATAALCVAASYLVSLVAAPAALYLICGRAPLPVLEQSIWTAISTLPPFVAGAIYTWSLRKQNECILQSKLCNCPTLLETSAQNLCNCTTLVQNTAQVLCDCSPLPHGCAQDLCNCKQSCMLVARICALVLLYFDCCERLREAEGSLHVVDVLGTMVFAVVYLSLSAGSWAAYSRAGLARGGAHARTMAICAVPKAMTAGWEVSTACVPGGLARLPAVFMAPAQALIVAAIADH